MAETRGDEIMTWVLDTLKENEFEDTTENRLAGLIGLRAAWQELEVPDDEKIEKALYGIALSALIFSYETRIVWPKV